MKQYKKWFLLLLTGCFLLAGCSKKTEDPYECKAGEYLIFCLDQDGYELVPTKTMLTDGDPLSMVQAMLAVYETAPKKPYKSVLSKTGLVKSTKLVDQELVLEFTTDYSELELSRELLLRTAFVHSFCQLAFVSGVTFCVNGTTITSHDGVSLNNMRPEDYVLGIGNEKIPMKVTLYFTGENGEYLVEEVRELECKNDKPAEQLILEALIKGPEQPAHKAVLSSKLPVPKAWTREGVCYVDFSSEFLKNPLQVKDIIPIYAVVNSLSELGYVNKVKLLVDGKSDVVFRDNVDLNQAFERSLDLVNNVAE